MRGKEDPFLKIGETNDRSTKGKSDYVWALQDVNLKVNQGEVLGIIGKNGAGKSTLLKLLSKVTAPTTGSIKARGRIASLLEVGTGFHPELTGRENIFLNGTILGMTRREVAAKLDEIVAFAGVERYLDTPVKRYSSGMKVRLGFAVAAHLEPEILVVDEVLAVGDAEFQKKAIGKMQDVSKEGGRTVLFVSHNMKSIETLCNLCVVLKDGEVSCIANPASAIHHYLTTETVELQSLTNLRSPSGNFIIDSFTVSGDSENDFIRTGHPLKINLKYHFKDLGKDKHALQFAVKVMKDDVILSSLNAGVNQSIDMENCPASGELVCRIPHNPFPPGKYVLRIYIKAGHEEAFRGTLISFDISEGLFFKSNKHPKTPGYFYLTQDWSVL